MKNSKKYSKEIEKLFRSLKIRSSKVKFPAYTDPVDAVIYAALSEYMADPAAKTACRKLGRHFVDWNDLRVSRSEEILDVLGNDSKDYEEIASELTRMLNAVFNRYHAVTLMSLTEIGKKQAKTELQELDGITPFVVNYCVLTSLHGHAIPLSEKMVDCLRLNKLVHPGADYDTIKGFLERQITSAHAYQFYTFLKRLSEKMPKSYKKKLEAGKAEQEKKEKVAQKAPAKKAVTKKTVAKKTKKSPVRKSAAKKKTTAKAAKKKTAKNTVKKKTKAKK